MRQNYNYIITIGDSNLAQSAISFARILFKQPQEAVKNLAAFLYIL